MNSNESFVLEREALMTIKSQAEAINKVKEENSGTGRFSFMKYLTSNKNKVTATQPVGQSDP